MKNSSKKLLLLLRTENSEPWYLPVADLPLLLPELSPGGRRSLLHWLKTQRLIEILEINHQSVIVLTELGQKTLEQSLPLFSLPAEWQHQWQVMIFIEGSGRDGQFHQLRAEVLKTGGLPLTRAVYAFPNRVPERIRLKCERSYLSQVVILTVSRWELGDARALATQFFGLNDLLSAYSSISRDISSLLIPKYSENKLNYQSKIAIYSLYARFFAYACEDTGLLRHFYPTSPTATSLLEQIQFALR